MPPPRPVAGAVERRSDERQLAGVKVDASVIRVTTAALVAKASSAVALTVRRMTVPAVPTPTRQECALDPVGIPAASVNAVASTHVTDRPSAEDEPCRTTVQLAGLVAAATASAYGVGVTVAITAVCSVVGSAGTVISAGSKYRQDSSAGSVTACH